MTKTHSTRKHSSFAASSSKRWITCPGSVALCEKSPEQGDSKYAREGTEAHECLEFLVKRWGKSTWQSGLENAKKKWSEDKIENALLAIDAIFNKLRPSPTAKLIVEERVFLKQIGKELFGTLDYAWVDEWGKLVIIDYKYGQGVAVFPEEDGEENPQLMYYAAGLAHKFDYEFDSIELVIIQPRVWGEDEEKFVTHTTSIKRLRQFEMKVAKAVDAAKKPDAPLNPSEDACRWCSAAVNCPALGKGQLAKAEIVFDVQDGVSALPDVKALTPQTLPKVLDALDLIETWIEKVRDHAFILAQKGEKIQGRKIVQKRSTRVWTGDAEKEAKKLFGDNAYRTEFLSPAQLEKAVGKEAKSFTEKFTSNVSTGVTLVKETDKRPEVTNEVVFDI